jgi:hypothetical protein
MTLFTFYSIVSLAGQESDIMGRSAEKDFQSLGGTGVVPRGGGTDTQTCSAAGSRGTGVNISGSWSGVSAVRS